MTGTLISILFLLNILFAFALLLLYMRQNRLMEIEKRQKRLLEESEQAMSLLLEEIKEENESLLRRINEIQAEANGKVVSETLVEELEIEQKVEEPLYVSYDMNQAEQERDSGNEELMEHEPDFESLPLRDQVDLMASQGLSVTQIAKKLNKGKTEIELLMKFQ